MTNDPPGQPFRIASSNHPSSSSWAYDSAFGITHRHGCQICRSYRTHLIDADESDLDYAQAIHDREAELQTHFMDGFDQGRETQRQHGNDLLKKCRSQRDSALKSRSLYKARLEEAEAVVERLCNKLIDLRLTYEGLVEYRTSPEYGGWNAFSEVFDEPSCGHDFDEPDFDLTAPGIDESSDEDEYEEDPWAPVLVHPKLDGDEDIEDRIGGPSGWADYPPEAFDHSPPEDLDEADEVPQLSLLSLRFTTDDEHVENRRFQPKPPGPSARHPAHPPNVSRHRSGYNAEGIRRKMDLAWHPENEHILAEVKSLVSAAHMTPTNERTEVQRILLTEWRNPLTHYYPSSSPRHTLTFVRSSDVCVDASQLGIGFVFKNQWQAWRLKEGWKERTREIQWAEAVAIELGVRLMIEAGYRQCTLHMCSDNSGVVEALSKGEIYRSQVGETVQRIYHLCLDHDITLDIKWIPGWANPADDPSRLCPEEGTSRFPHTIRIPKHLREFVFPYAP